MRLDCKNYTVVYVPRAKIVESVLWVDPEVPEFAHALGPKGNVIMAVLFGVIVECIHECTKIVVHEDRKLVLIDPVDDNEDDVFDVTNLEKETLV